MTVATDQNYEILSKAIRATGRLAATLNHLEHDLHLLYTETDQENAELAVELHVATEDVWRHMNRVKAQATKFATHAVTGRLVEHVAGRDWRVTQEPYGPKRLTGTVKP